MQSAQKRCKHSFVVMVFFNISKHIGHISSLWRLRGETTISKPSVIASYKRVSLKLNATYFFIMGKYKYTNTENDKNEHQHTLHPATSTVNSQPILF